MQIHLVLDADGDADQGFGDAHAGAPLGTHLVEDRVGDGNDQGTRVTEVARGNGQIQTIEEIEAIDALF